MSDQATAPVAATTRDIGIAFLPVEHPVAMPVQDFNRGPSRPAQPPTPGSWVYRAALFAGALLLTVGFARELYSVLSFVQITPIQILFLVFSTLAFGWIALGSLSAAIGFLSLFAGERADSVLLPELDPAEAAAPLEHRTALLLPVYHEDCASIAGTIHAIADELANAGHARSFDVFILSDGRTEAAAANEEELFSVLASELQPILPVYYRRRRENTGRKAGNIRDWIERFGGTYETFIVLDADSVMSGETLVRLVRAMQENPAAGLIQTVPRLVGGRTIFQRLQQFAAGVYGPAVAAGLAVWQRSEGNYWGHNAIVRTRAFASAAGLPELPGRRPFGGHILSHDFVEAALLQRNGWEVHMVSSAKGSYEGAPPGLIELAVRDRRWAQGNLQHLSIVRLPALTLMGRVHLAMGAAAYIVSAVWATSLAVGVVLALQGQHVIPSYFHDAKSLFPIWPTIDPGAAFRLFLATMIVVLMPKVFGLVLEIRRALLEGSYLAAPRLVAGVVFETAFSMLFAPILMATQTTAVTQIMAGIDAGWKAQRRDGASVGILEVLRFHRWHMLIGVGLAMLTYLVAWSLMAWMSAILLGLSLSAFMSWWTARPAGPIFSNCFAIDEDWQTPPILIRTRERAAAWAQFRLSGELPQGGLSLSRAA